MCLNKTKLFFIFAPLLSGCNKKKSSGEAAGACGEGIAEAAGGAAGEGTEEAKGGEAGGAGGVAGGGVVQGAGAAPVFNCW